MGQDTRSLILSIVQETLKGRDLQTVLNETLSRHRLPESDKGLCTTVCYNYLRLKLRIDFILSRNIKGKARKLPPQLLLALGVAVYEILYLDRVPEYATVHWYVEYTKARISRRLSGLANAVLREVARSRESFFQKDFYRFGTSSRATFLSRYYSCPQWIVDLWMQAYGEAACLDYLRQSLEGPLLGARVNKSLPEHEALFDTLRTDPACVAQCPSGLAFDRSPGVALDSLERKGLLSRQSYAAQSLLLELEPHSWPQPVWDACAGHGGKTCLLLEQGIPGLWASDLSPWKLIGLKRELDRLHLPHIPAFSANAAQAPPLNRSPGTILLDVPCSGLGVLSRRPDSKWKKHPQDVERLKMVQSEMLEQGVSALAPGGYLIYVTCTLNPEENEKQVQGLLGRQEGGVSLLDMRQTARQSGFREFFFAAKVLKKGA